MLRALVRVSKRLNESFSKQPNKQANKQTNKQPAKQISKQTNTKIGMYYLENDDRDPTKCLARPIRRRDPKAVIWEHVNVLIDNSCNPLNEIMQHNLSQNPECKFLILGGFPCQDPSRAGPQKGLTGSRSKLFAVLFTVIAAAQKSHRRSGSHI